MWFHPIRLRYGELMDKVLDGVELHSAYLCPNIQARILPMNASVSLSPVDMRPTFVAAETLAIEDFAVFKPIHVAEDFEIYLNKKDESEILDLLLKKQDPRQKEIRENRRHRAWQDRSFVEEPKGYDPYSEISMQLIIVGG